MKIEILHKIPHHKPLTVLPTFGSFLMNHNSNYKGLKTDKDFVIVMTEYHESTYVGIYISQFGQINAKMFEKEDLQNNYTLLPYEYSIKITQDKYE